MSALIRTGRVGVRSGIDAKTGVVIERGILGERVEWLANLTRQIAQTILNNAWSETGLDAFTDPKLPSQGYVAVRRAYGLTKTPSGIYAPSRVGRMGGEIAARLLRGANHQRAVLTALLENAPLPRGATSVEVRNLRRSIRSFTRKYGRPPVDFIEIRPSAPEAPIGLLPLATTDREFCVWHEITQEHALLDVKLPVVESPTGRADWVWARIMIDLPDLVAGRVASGALLARPSLRVRSNGKIIADLVTEQPAPPLRSKQPQVVLGLDWGERRLLSGTDCWIAPDGQARTSGRPVYFDAKGAQRKLARLRRHAGDLRGRIARHEALTEGLSDARLDRRRARLAVEQERIWARYRELSRQLAHAAARWAVEHAMAVGADTIAIEDLKSLEARFPHRGLNARINHQVRGLLFDALADKCTEDGIRLLPVPARGTSSCCPRCTRRVRHQKSPDDPSRGRGWTRCACGLSADRDHAAAEHIARRVLDPDGKQGVLRRSHRPALARRPSRGSIRRARHSSAVPSSPISSSHSRPVGVSAGRCVRAGGTPRRQPSLEGRRQRPIVGTPRTARDLHGLATGFTDRVRLTLTHYREQERTRSAPAGRQESPTTRRTLVRRTVRHR